jgi:hypothetical protein
MGLPLIWPHFTVLVRRSLLRYAAPAIPTNPSPIVPRAVGTRGLSAVEMKDHMRKFILALALLSSTSAAFAQGLPLPLPLPGGRSGTPEEQAACNRDVQRFCRPVINQGDLVILSCLQQNRAQISAPCNQVLKSHGQ